MKRQTLILFIGTIVVFFMLIGAAVITMAVMPPDVAEEDIDLGKHFEEKKEKVMRDIKDLKFVNVQDYIKDKDNPVPDINRALSENRYVFFPKSLPFLNGKISLQSHSIVRFEAGAKIFGVYPSVAPPGDHCLFSAAAGVENVTIIGDNAAVYVFEQGSPEEGFPTICTTGAKDIFIMDLALVEPMGYGLAISKDLPKGIPSENVEIFNLSVNSAKKGGVWIESAKGVKMYKVSVVKSAGKLPGDGFTIVSTDGKDQLSGIEMQEISTKENRGVGMYISPGIMMEHKFSMVLKGFTSTNDGEFAPVYLRNSPAEGKVTLKNLNLVHNEGLSAIIRTWDTKKCGVDVLKPVLNGDKGFEYVVTDQKNDPFPSNLENLNIKK